MIDQIENLPEVSFIDGITLDNVRANLISNYQEKYKEVTGKSCTLTASDPITLILYACAVQLYQNLLYTDRAGKMDLLKYAYDEFLDGIAATKGITRLPAKPAVCTVRFAIDEALTFAVGVPQNTRVKSGSTYFYTDAYAEIAIGDTYVDIPCTCDTTGESGNGIPVGSVNALADSVPYISSVSNIDETSGGADIEDDEDLADRVYLAPSGYSVAGPKDAYTYFVNECNSGVGSVVVVSPSECVVNVYVLMEDGSLPTASELSEIEDYLSDETRRPLTDHVTVLAPSTSSFDIDVTYYINRSDSSEAVSIQEEVAEAIDEYIEWQTSQIGRDINPSELEAAIMEAGAKRVVINYPVFTVVGSTTVPVLGTKTVTYGGIEDD